MVEHNGPATVVEYRVPERAMHHEVPRFQRPLDQAQQCHVCNSELERKSEKPGIFVSPFNSNIFISVIFFLVFLILRKSRMA